MPKPDTVAVAGIRPEVVVLCGSTRFKADFEREVVRLGLEGKIVLNVSCYGHSGDLPPEACIDGHPTKRALDELHKRKIDMADRVLVINPGGYVGASTRSEIEYAEWFEKPIDYLVDPGLRHPQYTTRLAPLPNLSNLNGEQHDHDPARYAATEGHRRSLGR